MGLSRNWNPARQWLKGADQAVGGVASLLILVSFLASPFSSLDLLFSFALQPVRQHSFLFLVSNSLFSFRYFQSFYSSIPFQSTPIRGCEPLDLGTDLGQTETVRFLQLWSFYPSYAQSLRL